MVISEWRSYANKTNIPVPLAYDSARLTVNVVSFCLVTCDSTSKDGYSDILDMNYWLFCGWRYSISRKDADVGIVKSKRPEPRLTGVYNGDG